jgi:hypothetical protein
MTTTSSEIQGRAFLRIDAGRAVIAAALVVSALSIGLVLDRVTAPRTEPAKATVSETISTRWLADTSPLRLSVMDKMNEIAPEVSPFVASSSVTTQVMRHMNSMASAVHCSRRRACVTEPGAS